MKPFIAEEVKNAAFQIDPNKAPGPDGIAACFYQKYWHLVGPKVTKTELGFLNGEDNLDSINHTNVVLIPKKKSPKLPSDFRPISLCSVLYKIISKTLVNRMKVVLNSIIDETQSAFVPRRSIFDNIIVAHETICAMTQKNKGKKGFAVAKLDISKAYDRVSWNFLEGMLRVMRFPDNWICMIMNCVTSVTYSIMLNGYSCGDIVPTRG